MADARRAGRPHGNRVCAAQDRPPGEPGAAGDTTAEHLREAGPGLPKRTQKPRRRLRCDSVQVVNSLTTPRGEWEKVCPADETGTGSQEPHRRPCEAARTRLRDGARRKPAPGRRPQARFPPGGVLARRAAVRLLAGPVVPAASAFRARRTERRVAERAPRAPLRERPPSAALPPPASAPALARTGSLILWRWESLEKWGFPSRCALRPPSASAPTPGGETLGRGRAAAGGEAPARPRCPPLSSQRSPRPRRAPGGRAWGLSAGVSPVSPAGGWRGCRVRPWPAGWFDACPPASVDHTPVLRPAGRARGPATVRGGRGR